MKDKSLLVLLNIGLLLVMFSRATSGMMANALILNGAALAVICGVMYWRQAKQKHTKKTDK
ncbi:hypothetical protein [Lacticaseibacillus sharpeae]|nr:hypothetical protein [Lacticaseibacillus sharpeae]